ncbi:MAG: magnesium-translocating P-type ATPase [Elusimicrobia bacterium]|nr:magnesium-translocating P-type ATPase [Elusimicrobiota bacterium]
MTSSTTSSSLSGLFRRGVDRSAAARAAAEGETRLLELAGLPPEGVLAKLGASERGLEPDAVAERLERHGPNVVETARKLGLLGEIWERAKNPLVVQLLVIAGASLLLHDVPSAVLVGLMVVLSVVLAYVQEARSGRAVERLLAMVKTNCVVVRGGREETIPLSALVPGDVVVLAAGSIIPADLRLLSAKDFFVSQAALTGEAMPIEKSAAPCARDGKSALELANVCFQGSNVLSGSARGAVVCTGARTYFGSISQTLAGRRVQTSFDRGVEQFTWLMIRFMIVMVAVVFVAIGLTKHSWIEALMFGLAVAVGLTPEMLPMIVTVNLSKGALAMSKKKVIVKRLNSIQNFGAMDILCTDKTGTLTQDKIVLERHVDVTNRESDDVLRYAYLNSYYQTGLRNLLDKAILEHKDLDVERAARKVDEIPFDFQRRRMSVVIDYEGDHVLICKGAVEEVFSACSRYQVDDEIHPLIDMLKKDLLEEYEDLSADGFRVLAIAYREFPRDKEVFAAADESDLILLGYVAFFDPPKESANAALEALRKAGVATKILTGDNDLVTRKICRDVGLPVDGLTTGDKLRGLSDDELTALAERTTVFARLSPAQKDQIIRALQRGGRVVGFMGDGINDAPAMKTADVGISVDTAVDVAKESADIILLKKSLLVLEDGIIEGRKVFGNIVKYIKMGASSNFGNMFSVVGASVLLPFLPMTPIQVLLNNLLYDVSQLGIPTDRVDEEYLLKPRKWNIASIKKFMLWIGPMSSIFDYTTFALLFFVYKCRLFSAPGASPAERAHWAALFHSGWFVESLLTQTLIVHVIRTNKIPFVQSAASPVLTLTTLAVMTAAAVLPFSPLAGWLGLTPLPLSFFGWMAATMTCYVLVTHAMKTRFIAWYGAD